MSGGHKSEVVDDDIKTYSCDHTKNKREKNLLRMIFKKCPICHKRGGLLRMMMKCKDCGKSIHKKCLTNSNGKENDQPGLIVDPVKKQIITIDEHWDNHNSSRDGQEERELVVVHQEKSPSVAELNDVVAVDSLRFFEKSNIEINKCENSVGYSPKDGLSDKHYATTSDHEINKVAVEDSIRALISEISIPTELDKCIDLIECDTSEESVSDNSSVVRSEREDNKDEYISRISRIFNRINGSNIISTTELLILDMNSKSDAVTIIKLLFKKTETDTNYIHDYIAMCTISVLGNEMVYDSDENNMISFKELLIEECKILLYNEYLKQSEFSEFPLIAKEIYTFIGEMYNNYLLPSEMLYDFILCMLSVRLSDNVLSIICYFIKIVGENLERMSDFDQIITSLKKHSTFAVYDIIMEVVLLRTSNWNRTIMAEEMRNISHTPALLSLEKKCIIAGEESSGEEDNVIDEKSNGIIDIAHCSKDITQLISEQGNNNIVKSINEFQEVGLVSILVLNIEKPASTKSKKRVQFVEHHAVRYYTPDEYMSDDICYDDSPGHEDDKDDNSHIEMIFNRITPSNIITTTETFTTEMNMKKDAQKLIQLMFKKVETDSNCIKQYIAMCTILVMENKTVRDEDVDDDEIITICFKDLLIENCKIILYKEYLNQRELRESPLFTKKIYKFIAELYNSYLIPSEMVFDFVLCMLSSKPSNNMISIICYFIKIVGKNLEKTSEFEQIMTNLKKHLSFDVYHIIMEVAVLQKNNWIK